MSREGMKAAVHYGSELPEFSSHAEAEAALCALRNSTLSALISDLGQAISLDFSGESLKRLEAWFIENGSPETIRTGYSLPHAIGFYFGEVLCKTSNFSWVVEELPFQRGRYEIGVKRPLLSIMLTKGKRPSISGNKRMQSLWREWKSYAL